MFLLTLQWIAIIKHMRIYLVYSVRNVIYSIYPIYKWPS